MKSITSISHLRWLFPPLVAGATKGGLHFLARQGGCMVFARQRRYKKWRRRRRTSPVERYFIPPEGGALNPSGRRQPVPDRTLGAQGQRPGGAINPRPRKTTVGRLNGRPFYGQAKGQLRPTCTSYAGCAHQPSGILESTPKSLIHEAAFQLPAKSKTPGSSKPGGCSAGSIRFLQIHWLFHGPMLF